MRTARRFYQSCLDTKSIDAAGAEPFLALIQKVRGIKNLSFYNVHPPPGLATVPLLCGCCPVARARLLLVPVEAVSLSASAAGGLGRVGPVESHRFQLHPQSADERLRHLSVLQPPGGPRPQRNDQRESQQLHPG